MSDSHEHEWIELKPIQHDPPSDLNVCNESSYQPLSHDTTPSPSTEPILINVTSSSKEAPVLSKWSLISIYAVIISDSVALTVMTPFITQYCRDWLGLSESSIDSASGWLLGSFSFAVFLSSFFLGHISDQYGRKPLILIGLLTSVIGTVGFAITTNFWIALSFRIFSGLTNSNIALCKAVITDVTTNAESRAMAFAYQGAAFSVARVISSAVGGVTQGINIFGYDNPFFLPCFIGGLVNAITLLISFWAIPETLTSTTRRGNQPLSRVFHDLWLGLRIIYKDPLLRKLMIIQSINAYSNGALLLLFVLHCSLEIEKGGLNFSALWTGMGFAWFGLCAVIFQLCFYKKLHKKLTLTKIYYVGCLLLVLSCVTFPLPALLYHDDTNNVTPTNTTIICILMSIICIMMATGFMTALPVIGTMISNACDPNRQGLTLGTAQSIASLLRGIGPLTAGSVFSLTTTIHFPQLSFIILTCCNIICMVIIHTLTEEEQQICAQPKKKHAPIEIETSTESTAHMETSTSHHDIHPTLETRLLSSSHSEDEEKLQDHDDESVMNRA